MANVHDKRVHQTSECTTFHATHHLHLQSSIIPQPNMSSTLKEAQIILALEAIQRDKNLTLRAASKIYDIHHTILIRRRNGKPIRYDIPANSRKLTDLEEKTII